MPRTATARKRDPTSTERVRRYRERLEAGEVCGWQTVSRNVTDLLVDVGLLAAWRMDNPEAVMEAAREYLELAAWEAPLRELAAPGEPRDREHP